MSGMILITGGARSGKSSLAESIAKKYGDNVLYIATSVPFDDEMKDRIRKHRAARPENWKTLEAYKDFDMLLPREIGHNRGILLDCITVMITNIMFEQEMDFDKINSEAANRLEAIVKKEIEKLIETGKKLGLPFILVTNETGMGIVPDNAASRAFRDIAGRMNQLLAGACDEVYVCISGIPLKLK